MGSLVSSFGSRRALWVLRRRGDGDENGIQWFGGAWTSNIILGGIRPQPRASNVA